MDKKPKTDADWVSLVDERFKSGENWSQRKKIIVQTNYYEGNQWISWNAQHKAVQPYPNYNNEERITRNVIRPRVMTKVSKLTKNRVKYDVRPDTNSQDRIELAKAAKKAIRAWWDEQEMDKKTRDIHLNNGVKGFCAAKVYFDPEKGQDITPAEGEEGYEEGVNVFTGEIVCRICDPLTLFIDPAATTDDEIRWICEEKPRDIDYIEAKYKKKVAPDEGISYLSGYSLSGESSSTQKKNKNMAMVRELWIAPCPEYPNGAKVTATVKELLDVDENAGEIPYVIFGDVPIPGKVIYDAFIHDMLPVQREINIIHTMFATHAKRMGSSKWMIPLGSQVDEEELNDEMGGFIYFNGQTGQKPERAAPPDIPSFYDRILEYGKQDIDDMSGAREISQGRLPAGLDTYGGLELMVEQENEKLTIAAQNFEMGMKKLLKRVLRLMKKHYTEERLFRIMGEDNEIEVFAFTGSDLSGEEDIDIVQGSSLPESRAAQENKVMQLWGAGAIVRKDGTPDPDALLRLLGMGDSSELFEQHQLDENKAKTENKIFMKMMEDPQALAMVQQYQKVVDTTVAILQEQMVPPEQWSQFMPPKPEGFPIVRDFYDHEIHIYQHNVFRKSSEYDELPPELQALVDAHVKEHEDALKAPEIAAQQQQMMEAEQQAAQQQQAVQAESERMKMNQEHQVRMKEMDNQAKLQQTAMQGDMAMQTAQMRGVR